MMTEGGINGLSVEMEDDEMEGFLLKHKDEIKVPNAYPSSLQIASCPHSLTFSTSSQLTLPKRPTNRTHRGLSDRVSGSERRVSGSGSRGLRV